VVYHGPAPQPEEIPLIRECWEKKRRVMEDLPSRMWSLEEDLSKMEESRAATRKPQPMQKDRTDILSALLMANGGNMLAKDARKKMHLSKERFRTCFRFVTSSKENRIILIGGKMLLY